MGIGLAYKSPEETAAANFDASARAVTQPPAGSGIGLASTAALPDNDGGPPVPDTLMPTPVQTATLPDLTPAPAPQAPQQQPLIDFHKNPLGAIGLVLESAVAGFRGTESPVDKLRQQQFEEQAQQYKTAELALNIVDKTSRYVSKLPSGQRAAAIKDLDSRFSGALGGHSIGGILTAFSSGTDAQTAARLEALKALNPSPAMLSYWASDPDAATKALDSYSQHQLTKETPEEAGAKAKAVTTAQNTANKDKPITPAEQAQIDISKGNAKTAADTLAETQKQHGIENTNAQNKPLTADQANAATFADRLNEAETVLSKYGHLLASGTGRLLDNVPGGNAAQSADYQKASQAKLNFLMAVLRKESGAAIGKDELATGDQQYFPQFGDTQAKINQKTENRDTVRVGMERSAGPSYKRPAPVIHYGADGKPL